MEDLVGDREEDETSEHLLPYRHVSLAKHSRLEALS